jgi:cytochrome b
MNETARASPVSERIAELRRVRVWDVPTRLFHWLVMVLVGAAYASWRLNWMEWHVWCGEILLAALLFRLLWGVFGSDTARFSHFVASPMQALRHIRSALRREPDRQVGHNPAGGWMVLLLLLLLLGEALTGVYVNNDIADVGPLTEMTPARVANAIERLHALIWDALLAAIALHLLAILVYAVNKGQNLLRPMITGVKLLPPSVAAPRFASPTLAALLLAISAAAATLLANAI